MTIPEGTVDKIIEAIRGKYGTMTFAEIEGEFPFMFGGDFTYHVPDKPNLILWTGFTEEGVHTMHKAMLKGDFYTCPMPGRMGMLCYLYDGVGIPPYPVGEHLNYKTPHWIPTVIKPIEREKKK